jgi:hypothetical protein
MMVREPVLRHGLLLSGIEFAGEFRVWMEPITGKPGGHGSDEFVSKDD